ncbi:MAG TPA: tetratricopeptide repeat protein [Candidatus Brocadiales bacterium]|nr:tetratricopeptide repeat protein [Candidatus Brocadiales bacterium]
MPEIQETPSAEQEREEVLTPLILGRLVKIARGFENQGNAHQAIGLYTKILQEYPDSKEAEESRLSLFNLAEKYLHEGNTYHALALYDKVV